MHLFSPLVVLHNIITINMECLECTITMLRQAMALLVCTPLQDPFLLAVLSLNITENRK
jgi:hypothetical protein